MRNKKAPKKQQLIQYILDNYKDVLRDKIKKDRYNDENFELLLNLTSANSWNGPKQNRFIHYLIDIIPIDYQELKPFIGWDSQAVKNPLFNSLIFYILEKSMDKSMQNKE